MDSNLDREEQDYSLEASVGVGSPLKLTRQYKKNIGRTLIVKTSTEIIEAELVNANDDFVILSWKAREPKKGKGKETVQKELTLPYVDIKEAIVTVTF
jgi:ribosome maturation factor RimP